MLEPLLVDALRKHSQTISFCESLTAGLASARVCLLYTSDAADEQ